MLVQFVLLGRREYVDTRLEYINRVRSAIFPL